MWQIKWSDDTEWLDAPYITKKSLPSVKRIQENRLWESLKFRIREIPVAGQKWCNDTHTFKIRAVQHRPDCGLPSLVITDHNVAWEFERFLIHFRRSQDCV